MNKAKILAVISSVAIATASVGADEFIKASSFGWNAEDSTSALQSAIDSGAKRVMIDRQAGDWVVRPIFLRTSGQEVIIADGVTVRAKKGEFKGRGDCLFRIAATNKNVTLRGEGRATLAMNKKDYQDPSIYDWSEWRHAVSILGTGVTVRDLTILSSGGDGVYVADNAKDVVLENIVCRDHHRQGISVISATRLRVRNCRFEETSGTAPQCGVDIEPSRPWNHLEDILFEDCTFTANASCGILLHLTALGDETSPVSVTFRRCKSLGNANNGIRVACAGPYGAGRGSVTFEDCSVSENRKEALIVAHKRSDALDLTFRNCTLDARGSAAGLAVRFDNGTYLGDFGGVSFENVRVVAGKEKVVAFDGAYGTGIAVDTLKGALTVVREGCSGETFSLPDFARKHPLNPAVLQALQSFKTEKPNFRKLKALPDAKPLASPVSTGWLRGRFSFVQWVPGAGDYPVVFRTRPIGNHAPVAYVQVRDALGTDLGSFTVENASVTNVIHAKKAGIRHFEVKVKPGLAAVESVWPGHGVLADNYVQLFGGRNRRYYFAVPREAENVCVQVRPQEPCSARLLRPDGSVAAEMEFGNNLTLLEAKRGKAKGLETWCIEFPCIDEDTMFRIGSPALPFASPHADVIFCP